MITRGTTPTNYFRNLPFDPADCAALYVTYAQNGKILFEKTLDDISIDGDTISVPLSQEDTLAFSDSLTVEIQIAARLRNGSVFRSYVILTNVGRVLHDSAI